MNLCSLGSAPHYAKPWIVSIAIGHHISSRDKSQKQVNVNQHYEEETNFCCPYYFDLFYAF